MMTDADIERCVEEMQANGATVAQTKVALAALGGRLCGDPMGLSIDVDDGDVEIRWALATGRGLTVGHDGYGLRARVHSWVRILTVDVEPSGVMRWYASAVGVKTDIDPNAEGIAPAGDSLAFLRPWLDGGRLPPEVVER